MSSAAYVVLDTSVLHNDYTLDKAPIRELLNVAALCSAVVTLPRIAFDEHVRHYEEDSNEYRRQIKKALEGLNHLPLQDNATAQIPEVTKPYSEFLQDVVGERNAEILDYPQVDHKFVLQRDFERRKPFGEKGKGYRDTLIWETILELLHRIESIEVIFITSNHKDFAESGSGPLHRHLIKDLIERGYGEECVHLELSLKSASNYLRIKFGLAALTTMPDVEQQIKDNVNFDDFLTAHKKEIEECINRNSENIIIGDSAQDASLYWNVEDCEVEIDTTEVLDDGEVVVYARAEFENEVQYGMFLSSFYAESDSLEQAGVSLYNADEDIDWADVGGTMVLSLEFSFVYNPTSHEVSGFEALEVRRTYLD